VLFLDDDIVPFSGLLEGHRRAFALEPGLSATSGQVLQPWNPEPIPGSVPDKGLGFDFASSEAGSSFECDLHPQDQPVSWASCAGTSFTPSSDLPDGAYTFEVRATDSAGGTDATPAKRDFTVDASASPTGTAIDGRARILVTPDRLWQILVLVSAKPG